MKLLEDYVHIATEDVINCSDQDMIYSDGFSKSIFECVFRQRKQEADDEKSESNS